MPNNFHRRKLASFQDKHKNETCIVCGLGSSLLENYKELYRRYKTIGVNDINSLFDPTYHVITEHIGGREMDRWNEDPQFKAKTETILSTTAKYVFSPYDTGYKYKKPVKTEFVDLRREPIESVFPSNRLFAYRKVTTAAISLAMWLGFNRIGVIGFDMKGNRATNCFSNALNCEGRRLKEMNFYCEEIFNYAYRNEVEIYNLSDNSAITAFPTVTREKFKEIDNEFRSDFNRDCVAHITHTSDNTSSIKVSKYHLYDFKNKYSGPCLVCGTGDSLNDLTQKMVNTYPVIGVNGFVNAYTPDFEVLTDNIDINFDYDTKLGKSGLNQKSRNIINNTAKYTLSPNDLNFKHSEYVPIRLLSMKNYPIEVTFSRNMLCVYYSTIMVAIAFAMYAGFNQVGILGYDLYKHPLQKFEKELNWGMAQMMLWGRTHGVELLNLSQRSLIKSIPTATIQEFNEWYEKNANKKLD